ncbi:UpxY family transcription antiterminator [Polaribacter sp. IC073]|uniref:UpxY family transcription antiterminator n=1 Tax=Polaribacter sp. IC073 TaxID=2508540 RepID=UPI0011BDEF26|nr:UpxY family transcription antiterminator [Polaribacter sp. IC073]TXD47745.1 UpxY family transcription antiterminator [Polaribacter sp. IC073]
MHTSQNRFGKKQQWFAVYTRPKAEVKVDTRLSLAGFNSFLPLQTVIKQWSDRKKKVQVPLINSYVFVQSKSIDLNKIYKIPGVINILKHSGKYASIKDIEIENLKILTTNGFPMKAYRKSKDLLKGTKVMISKGPLKGLSANYLMKAGKHKVIVELETLNCIVEVTVSLCDIKEIS